MRMDRETRLLRIAKALQWLGVLWNIGCVGIALLAIANQQRFSDGVSDAVPVALLGGVGFSIAWAIAWVIKGLARERHHRDQDH